MKQLRSRVSLRALAAVATAVMDVEVTIYLRRRRCLRHARVTVDVTMATCPALSLILEDQVFN